MTSEGIIRDALEWYAEDRRNCADAARSEEDEKVHQEIADQAMQIWESLGADDGGITIVNQGPMHMISPDGDHEEVVSVYSGPDHVKVEVDDGRQIVIDIGNHGELRADFFAPDGPAGGDAETHVELITDNISVTDNF